MVYASSEPGKNQKNGLDKGIFLRIVEVVKISLGGPDLFVRIGFFRSRPLEDKKIQRGKDPSLESRCDRAVLELDLQVSPRPIQDRHEIVADGIDTAFPQIPD